MYDELIGNLRAQATHFSVHDETSLLLLKAADAIEDLDNRLNLHRQGKIGHWISVTERLPEESGDYLIYVVGGEFKQWSMVTMAYYYKMFYYDYAEPNFDQITHWMPLPEPPDQTFGNYPNHCQKSKEGES